MKPSTSALTETADANPVPRRIRGRGWGWPALIVALLVGGAGANIWLMLVATGDASFAVEADYYEKALRWDDAMAQEARNARLGWSVAVRLERAAQPGEGWVRARVVDRDGVPVAGARVGVEAFHSARASRIVRAGLTPEAGGGYAARLPLDRPGLWELRVRVERGDQVFTRTLDQDLGRAP